jgi:hypothetical protein
MLGVLAEPDRWNATTLRDLTKKNCGAGVSPPSAPLFGRRLAACLTLSD